MPWDIWKRGDEYCVHKKKPDGSKGEKEGCHPTRTAAEKQMSALYASEDKSMKEKAKWSTKYINDLPDSAFLYIESGGEKNGDGKTKPRSLRHLPYKNKEGDVDLPHLRNAISRAPQIKLKDGSKISESKANSLQKKAKKILKREEGSEKSLDKMAVAQANSESQYLVPTVGAKTFEDLDEQREIEAKMKNFREDSEDFIALFKNIVYDSELSFADRADQVVELANGYADRIEQNFNQEQDEKGGLIEQIQEGVSRTIKKYLSPKKDKPSQEDGIMFYKDTDGSLRWIAKYSNNFRDEEDEIIAEKSHKRFVDLVDKGEVPYPDLLLWHEKSWKLGEADWIAYDDSGYALASGTIQKSAVPMAEWLSEKEGIRTSHGMPKVSIKRDENDPSVIVEHETAEISILPKRVAANKLTGFHIIDKSLQEDNRMAIPEDKKKTLLDWEVDEGILADLEKANEAEAEAAEDLGIDRKEKDEDEAAEDVDTQTKEEDVEEPEAEEKEESEELSRDEVFKALAMVAEKVEELAQATDERFSQLEQKIDASAGSAEEQLNKTLQETPSASLVGMLSKHMNASVIGKEETKVDGRTTLANSQPEEAEHEVKGGTGIPFIDAMRSEQEVQ